MSAATGLGPIETRLLDSYRTVDALSQSPFVKNQRILSVLNSEHQIAPEFGYRVLCDLARPWISHLRLVHFHGNYGSPDFGPAGARYTESRLSPLGEAALRAERGEQPALPIGLINGSIHVDGPAPPFDPRRVVTALLAIEDGASDPEVIDLVGLPSFPTGCHVSADINQLASGQEAMLSLEAHIEPGRADELVLSHLPPRSSPSEIASMIERRVRRARADDLPVADVNDESSGNETRVVVRLSSGADPKSVTRQLLEIWSIHTTMTVALGSALPTLFRKWVADHGTADLAGQLRPVLMPDR